MTDFHLNLSANARTTLEARYLRKDENGDPTEAPEDLFRRVARAVAAAERHWGNEKTVREAEEQFYGSMTSLAFLPNSPTLMNAGTDLGQLSGCFVLPVGDSLVEIFNTLRDAALVHQSGGGTGFSFSRLRPAGDRVRSTMGVSSGPVSFMRAYDAATDAIRQGGTRRGANMGVLRVDHPDILEFVRSKDKEGSLANFNISVAVTRSFLEALRNDEAFPLVHPGSGRETGRLPAPAVFEEIARHAWGNGEPGLVFIDRINELHPASHVGTIEATNPCGEQPLLPYESCNLGSINLLRVADSRGRIDWDGLRDLVHMAVRFLDDVIEVNRFPLPAIEAVTRSNRKIGLGVMGFADLLILRGTPYDSPAALGLAEKVASFLKAESLHASRRLAGERGPYPNFPGSPRDRKGGEPIRNATVNTVAPTGTLSLIAGVSSGIEPVFSFAYERHVLGTVLQEIHPLHEDRQKAGRPIDRRVFVTATEIDPEWHVRMQAAFQAHVDNGVSKTINFPNTAAVEDVKRAFLLADELGSKGLTAYRDRSRRAQVLNICDTKCSL